MANWYEKNIASRPLTAAATIAGVAVVGFVGYKVVSELNKEQRRLNEIKRLHNYLRMSSRGMKV